MRKVNLTMDENKKYEVIKRLVDDNGNKKRAALALGVSPRHINRMISGYKSQGKAFFVHGNRGHKPVNTIPSETRNLIIDLYRNKCFDANFTHFTELLAAHEDIHLSPSAVASILEEVFILSPGVTKIKRKQVKKTLQNMKHHTSKKD